MVESVRLRHFVPWMQLVRHCVGLLVKEVWRPWLFMVLVHKVDLVQMGSISVLSQMGLFQRFGPHVRLSI